MREFVSKSWVGVLGLVASLSVIAAGLVHYGYPGTARAGTMALLLLGVVLLSTRPARSIGDVIGDVEAEPERAGATRKGMRR